MKTVKQLQKNMGCAAWDLPKEVWQELEERTRPEEEYMSWYIKFNYERFFHASEFHDEKVELP